MYWYIFYIVLFRLCMYCLSIKCILFDFLKRRYSLFSFVFKSFFIVFIKYYMNVNNLYYDVCKEKFYF